MAAEKQYQVEIEAGTLYEVWLYQNAAYPAGGRQQIQPNIEVTGGTANIYGSQQNPTQADAPTGMYETATGFEGITSFGVLPNYLYVAQASGTITIILTGVGVKEVVD